ncbi:MAG: hypothetical protein WCF99_10715 [Chloroflexales bacterium]
MDSCQQPLDAATCLSQVEATYVRVIQAAARAHGACEQYVDEVHAAYTTRLDTIAQSTQAELGGIFRWSTAPWRDPIWETFAPETAAPIPATVRLGRFFPLESPRTLDLPALAPLIGHGHLFFLGEDPAPLRHMLSLTLLRLLVSFPPGMLRLTLVDPVTAGSALSAFLHLPPMLRGPDVIIRPEAMEQQLRELEDQIASLSQTRLANLYPTIEAYNASPDALTIPYRILALADLPSGLDERSAGRLLTIARNGPRVGIYIVASINASIAPPRNFALDTLTSLGTVVHLVDPDQLTWNDPLLANKVIHADPMPPVAQMNRWLMLVGRAASASMCCFAHNRCR